MTSATRTVTFEHPFQLPGADALHEPGSFELRSEEEALDVMWSASTMTYSLIVASPGGFQSVTLQLSEIDELMRLDRLKSSPSNFI